MRVTLSLQLPQETVRETDFYEPDDLPEMKLRVSQTDGRIYCWKTTGQSNWLESGLSVVDVLGYVILPQDLPDVIEMPDDRGDSA